MRIRSFCGADLPSMLALQGRCPLAANWGEADYLQLADDPCGMILVAEEEAPAALSLLGFAAFHLVVDEAELRNLAVNPERRRQGVGTALLAEARERLPRAGAKRLYLETRASNRPALELYYSLGFALLARRKNYYQNPDEDALVLGMRLARINPRSSG